MSKFELFPYQREHVEQALAAPAIRWLFGNEMGLGKTCECIETCRRLGADRILVICPALARQTWAVEFTKWWSEQFSPGDGRVGVIHANPSRKSLSKAVRERLVKAIDAPVRVVSPELLVYDRELAFLKAGPGVNRIDGESGVRPERTVCILDEVHYFVNADTGRSKCVDALLERFDGPILAASATPIPNRIVGLWNVLNTIWKGRFGYRRPGHPVPYQFLDAYCERLYNGYGFVWGGLRHDRADELRGRLAAMLSRTTRKEVKQRWPGLLPACQLRPMPVESCGVGDCVKAWVQDAITVASHCAVLTNLRATAADLASMLAAAGLGSSGSPIQILHVDGSTPPEERNDKIRALRSAPFGVLVTTMHAVCEAISLSWCHRALFAELYWRPKTLVQTVGRFPRLDGDTDIVIDVMCGADSVQAKMAMSISDKLMDQQKILPVGAADEGLIDALAPSNMEDELLAAAIHAAGDAWSDDFDKGVDNE